MKCALQINLPCLALTVCSVSADVNVRVSVLTLYGALVTTQAPLPEVQLLLRQPENGGVNSGSFTPQDSSLSWRHRNGAASPRGQQGSSSNSPQLPRTPAEEGGPPLWLLQLCVSLVTQPRDEHSDSDGGGGGGGGGGALEPPPVRLEALQVRDGAGVVLKLFYKIF